MSWTGTYNKKALPSHMISDVFSVWGWEQLLQEMESFLISSNREIQGTASYDYAVYALERLNICVQALSPIVGQVSLLVDNSSDNSNEFDSLHGSLTELLECCNLLVSVWQTYIDSLDSSTNGYHVPREARNGCGRPQLIITQDQLEYLRSLSFSWSEIARLLGVSRMTIYRRRQYYNIQENDVRRTMNNDELIQFLRQVRIQMPNGGACVVIGQLRSLGYHVCRQRVREAIRQTDPINTPLRWRGILTTRRPYSVAGPNSLWYVGKPGS